MADDDRAYENYLRRSETRLQLHDNLLSIARGEIKRLEAENQRLREALEKIRLLESAVGNPRAALAKAAEIAEGALTGGNG